MHLKQRLVICNEEDGHKTMTNSAQHDPRLGLGPYQHIKQLADELADSGHDLG